MNIALIHDHLAQEGGAEKVLRVLGEMYPSAPIYTLLVDQAKVADKYRGHILNTSIIQRLPGGVRHYQWYMPFMPMAVEFFNLKNYPLVISDASAFAKGVITGADTLHICYCHTPTRYLWDYAQQYIEELRYNKFVKKIISLTLNYLRLWDRSAADRVDVFIANSQTVRRRIKKYYRRDSTVIYPPVAVAKFAISERVDNFFLIGGRLQPYKRVDLAISAFMELGWPLKIFGTGADFYKLQKLAVGHDNIEFVGQVDDRVKAELYSHCQAFINPQEEDFGITVVEAMAAGRPVIAYAKGGALETVKENVSGIFFPEQTVKSLVDALRKFKTMNFNSEVIRNEALRFSEERFKREMGEFVEREYEKFKNNQ